MFKTTNSKTNSLSPTQQKRCAQLLQVLYRKGPQSRAQLAKATGITQATVSRDSALLLELAIIQEAGLEPLPTHHPGPRQTQLTIMSGGAVYLGVELTADSFSFCLTDRLGHVLAQQVITHPTPYDRKFLDQTHLIRRLQRFLKKNAAYQPIACGIALPGHYIETTQRIASSNAAWSFFDLQPVVAALGMPVYFENNVNCEALAESLIGKNHDGENFVYVHVARGVFCATIHDGEMYGTKNFAVGEISHTIVDPEGELCDCGRHGCLQTYASHESLVKKARVLFQHSPDSTLRQLVKTPEQINIDTVITAYQLGDPGIINLLTRAVRSLSAVLNNVALLIDARRMIVHGKLFDQPELLHLLQSYLDQNQFQFTAVAAQQVIVKPFQPFDGAIGGAMLAVSNTLLKP